MSLVSMIATDSFITFLSDGRVIDGDANEIVMEDYKKVHRINEKIIIGIAGSRTVSDTVLNNLDKLNITDIGPFGVSILEGLATLPELPKSFFVIGGIDNNGRIAYTHFDSFSTIINVTNIQPGDIEGHVLFNGPDLDFSPNEKLGLMVINAKHAGVDINPVETLKIQKDFNNIVALQDFSVNTTVYSEIIRR